MNRTLLAFAALTSSLAMSVAQANDGTINFTGELTAQTCTSTVNGSATTQTVALPRLSTASLATTGQTAGATNFTIELSRCTATIATAAAFFEAGPGVDSTTKNVKNATGTARNVQFQLLDSAGTVIKAGDTSQTGAGGTARTPMVVTTGASPTGSATLPYAVQYVATGGAATVGTVVGSVVYSINYQ
ncbi:fimbrial protein [Pseudomonas frederiksbergensis]|uniref:fimbrial protein n=1 Tax=Pseudomonas frederiksbergensis TaxID=104087 RepID=UPI003CFD3EE7